MDKEIRPKRFKVFCEALRRHWPNLTDPEISGTFGKFEKVEKLIEQKYDEPSQEIREKLAMIYDETQEGNPQTIDDYAGIERFKNDPPAPETNEWKAREDEIHRSQD